MGISSFEEGIFMDLERLMTTGKKTTTTGVLFTKAEITATDAIRANKNLRYPMPTSLASHPEAISIKWLLPNAALTMNIAKIVSGAGFAKTPRISFSPGRRLESETKETKVMIAKTHIAVKSTGTRSRTKLANAHAKRPKTKTISQHILPSSTSADGFKRKC